MMYENKYDVVVLGGGFTGCAAALAAAFYFLLPFDLEVRQALVLLVFSPIASAVPAFTARLRCDAGLSSAINSMSIVCSITFMVALLLIIIISITLNKIMLLGTSKTEVKIISEKASEIRDTILSQVDRGVTLLHGEGGYSHNSTEVLLSIVTNYELPKIERLARDIDPNCFMIISRVSEVWGRGFSFGKHK